MNNYKEISNQTKEVTDIDIAPHVLSIDPDGKLNLIGCDEENRSQPEWCEGVGEKDEDRFYEDNLKRYIDNIINGLKSSEKDLLIYIHGGLNSEDKAIERAKRKYEMILHDEKNPRYPVFVIWRSGGWTTYKDHILRIRQGEEDKHLLTNLLTIPVYLFTDLANSLVNTPKAWTVSGKQALASTLHAAKEKDIEEDIEVLEKAKVANIHFNGDQNVPNFLRHVHWVATSPFKAITTPFTYTLAKPAWDIMLRRTSTLFYTPDDLDFDKQSEEMVKSEEKGREVKQETLAPRLKSGNGALYSFLSALEADVEASQIKITLIGHSMGAIIINNIVHAGLKLTYENIVHMASADSIENLFNKVVPYIDCCLEGTCNSKKKVQFYSLHLHPDNENREVSAGGLTPSGSLLTWIDEMYTIPKTVLDKRSGRWDNMKRAIRLIPPKSDEIDIPTTFPSLRSMVKHNNIRGQMHFTIFGLQERTPYDKDTLRSTGINIDALPKECGEDENKDKDCLYPTAQGHGDFGDLPFWREEIWKGQPLSSE